MNVRPYNDIDLLPVAELFTAAVYSLTASHYSAEQRAAWAPRPPDMSHWRQRLQPLHTLVAVEDSAVAGFISYQRNGHIEFLYTSPAFAGRGVASLLYARAESALRSLGAAALSTEASLVIRPFFENRGFTITTEEDVFVRGVTFKRYAMHKKLVAAQPGAPADGPASLRSSGRG